MSGITSRIHSLLLKVLRSPWAAVAGLEIFILTWHLWALLLDQRLTGCSVDITIPATFQAMDQLRQGDLMLLLQGGLDPKGPVVPVLGAVLAWITGDVVLGCRLVSALAHTAMLAQVYDLGRFLPQRPRGRLWAPLYVAVSPLVFGWARLEFHEPVLAVAVLGALQVMFRARLDRLLPAVLLGLLLAMGLMTKLSFPVFMMAPGLWFVARRVRSLRTAAYLAVTLGVMGALCAPWLRSHLPVIMDNFHGSSHGPELWQIVLRQFIIPTHAKVLLVLSLVSALLLWWRRGTDRWVVALLLLYPVVCLALFVLRFHYWTRYMVPVYPIMALLGGAGISAALERLPRRLALPVSVVLALFLLGSFVQTNSSVAAANCGCREYDHGMLAPDLELYNGYTMSIRPFRSVGLPVMEVILPGFAHTRWTDMSRIWRSRGVRVVRVDREKLVAGHYNGRTIGVVVVGKIPQWAPGVYEGRCPEWAQALQRTPMIMPAQRAVLRRSSSRCLVTVVEPDHLTFAAFAYKIRP